MCEGPRREACLQHSRFERLRPVVEIKSDIEGTESVLWEVRTS